MKKLDARELANKAFTLTLPNHDIHGYRLQLWKSAHLFFWHGLLSGWDGFGYPGK